MLLTVFTPTYNREHLLTRLYESLLSQNAKDFEWLIVDDGSTDNTRELVSTWINQNNSFPIRYIYQENGGKYRAHNTGVKNADGKFFCCVDSDDILTPKAIEIMLEGFKKIHEIKQDSVIGLIGLISDFNGNALGGNSVTDDMFITSYGELYTRYPKTGDRALVYLTKILKMHLFPEIDGTKFITEAVVYNRIERDGYKMLFLNNSVMLREYLGDGYSNNIENLIQKYPIGFKIYWMEKIDMETRYLKLIFSIINYHNYSYLSDDTNYSYNGVHKTLVKTLRPIGFLMNVIITTKFGYQCKIAVKRLLCHRA